MTTPLSPAQRLRRWSAHLWLWRIHRWLGLGLGAVLVVLSLTGSLLVLHGEWERLLYPERHEVEAPAPGAGRAPLVPILQRLQEEAPAGFRPLRLEPGHGATASDKVIFVGPDRTSRWSAFVNPWTGEILWRGSDQSLITPWLLHLHMHLQAGKWGYLVTGLAAVTLIFLTFTGLWITRDRWATLLRRPFRRGRGGRVAAGELHKWVGMVSLYFTVVLGGTGLWFAILIVPGQFRREPAAALGPPFDLRQLAPLEPALAAAAREFPGSELNRVVFPWDHGVRVQVRVLHREAPIWEKQSRMEFDPKTGAWLRTVRANEMSPAEKWRSILAPLHFGFYGSTSVKWLYALGGLAPALLSVSGMAIWYLRRRRAHGGESSDPSVGCGRTWFKLPALFGRSEDPRRK